MIETTVWRRSVFGAFLLAALLAPVACGGQAAAPANNDAGCSTGSDAGADAGVDAGLDAGGTTLPSESSIDQLILPLLDAGWFSGAAVGFVDSSGSVVYGYGARDETGAKVDGDTEFEIGSITKAFTALLLAESTGSQVSLDDQLQADLGLQVPTMDGVAVTLQQLATHSSGLARLPANFTGPYDNPYPNYTPQEVASYLSGASLLFVPGTEYLYSNLAFGLLGYALGQKLGTPYRQLLADRILTPLGLSDTAFDLSPEQLGRFAEGHDGDLNPFPHWTWENDLPLEGAGALRSTARDLLKLAAAEIQLSPTSLSAAIASTHQVLFDDLHGTRTTLGLFATEDGFLWKDGGTGGFTSLLAFDLQRSRAVVLLVNASCLYTDPIGFSLLQTWNGENIPEVVPPTATLTSAELGAFVGTYNETPTFAVAITRTGDALYAQGTGQGAFRVYPESASILYARALDLRMYFENEVSGQFQTLVDDQNGTQYIMTR